MRWLLRWLMIWLGAGLLGLGAGPLRAAEVVDQAAEPSALVAQGRTKQEFFIGG